MSTVHEALPAEGWHLSQTRFCGREDAVVGRRLENDFGTKPKTAGDDITRAEYYDFVRVAPEIAKRSSKRSAIIEMQEIELTLFIPSPHQIDTRQRTGVYPKKITCMPPIRTRFAAPSPVALLPFHLRKVLDRLIVIRFQLDARR